MFLNVLRYLTESLNAQKNIYKLLYRAQGIHRFDISVRNDEFYTYLTGWESREY